MSDLLSGADMISGHISRSKPLASYGDSFNDVRNDLWDKHVKPIVKEVIGDVPMCAEGSFTSLFNGVTYPYYLNKAKEAYGESYKVLLVWFMREWVKNIEEVKCWIKATGIPNVGKEGSMHREPYYYMILDYIIKAVPPRSIISVEGDAEDYENIVVSLNKKNGVDFRYFINYFEKKFKRPIDKVYEIDEELIKKYNRSFAFIHGISNKTHALIERALNLGLKNVDTNMSMYKEGIINFAEKYNCDINFVQWCVYNGIRTTNQWNGLGKIIDSGWDVQCIVNTLYLGMKASVLIKAFEKGYDLNPYIVAGVHIRNKSGQDGWFYSKAIFSAQEKGIDVPDSLILKTCHGIQLQKIVDALKKGKDYTELLEKGYDFWENIRVTSYPKM